MTAAALPEFLTTVRHLHILADRYDKPVVEFGDYYAVVVEQDGEPIAFVAPKAEAAGLGLYDAAITAAGVA